MRLAMRFGDDLKRAVSFLTCLSVPIEAQAGRGYPHDGVYALPLVGVLIGAGGSAVAGLIVVMGGGGLLAATVAIGAIVMLTGGIHEDGFADTLDGFGIDGDAAARRAAMRAGGIGVYAVIGLILLMAVKIFSLAVLIGSPDGGMIMVTGVLVMAASASRWAMLWPLVALPPAFEDGVAHWFGAPSWRDFMVAGGVVILIAMVTVLVVGRVLPLIVAGLLAWAVTGIGLMRIRRRFGSHSGDMAGFCQQCCEGGFLLGAALAVG